MPDVSTPSEEFTLEPSQRERNVESWGTYSFIGFHTLIHMLIQVISHTYVTLEPQVEIGERSVDSKVEGFEDG